MNMLRFSFCGDIKLIDADKIKISEAVMSILKRCDYNIINFEAPVANVGQLPIEKSGPNISQSANVPVWLESHGWNVFSLANNHSLDYGEEGLLHTIDSFESAFLMGAGTWEDAYKPLVLSSPDGKYKIGLVACSHREFGCLHDEYSQKDKLGYAWICHPKIDEIIVNTKKEVDCLFVFAHAGVEHLEQPLPEWRTLYKHFIDMGSDGVIASHPHIPMGYETYKGKPIYYSLGNFCFQKDSTDGLSDQWFRSIMVEITLGENGGFSVENYLIVYSSETGELEIDTSMGQHDHVFNMCQRLNNQQDYLDFVNKKAVELLPWYIKLFGWSGLIAINDIEEVSLKTRIKYRLKGRVFRRVDNTTKTHLLNNLQCESHRWIIERALNNVYNID